MGIQDRDYYWEKHKETPKSNVGDFESLLNRKKSRYQKSTKKTSGNLKYLLTPALMLFALWHSADTLLKYKTAQQPITPTTSIPEVPAEPETIEPTSGGLLIKADQQGHFRGTVLINDVPMPFLIDTGATRTVIPTGLADEAGLVAGRFIHAHTAGGEISEQETRIDTLKIGNAVINNLTANINEHLEEVLIGMNTLKYFNITQIGNTMTLVVNGLYPQEIAQPPIAITPRRKASVTPPTRQDTIASSQPMKKPVTIKKTVTCDARGICRTKYSDR